jgi:hypothetical protein
MTSGGKLVKLHCVDSKAYIPKCTKWGGSSVKANLEHPAKAPWGLSFATEPKIDTTFDMLIFSRLEHP